MPTHCVRFALPFLFCINLLLLLPAHAQTLIKPAPYAQHITQLDNLNIGGEINNIYQSKNGYIWLGTNEGLVRFDGFNAKRFTHETNNPHSLNHNRVFDIIEDHNNNLWISTHGGGLSKYSPHTNQFSKIDLRLDPNDPPVSQLLYNLSIDKNNILWIGSVGGVMRLDIKREKAIPIPATIDLPKEIISTIYFDNQDQMWFVSQYQGLYWYDNTTLHHFKHDPQNPNGLNNNAVRNVYQDGQDNVWVSTQSGLNLFDRQSKTFTTFQPSANPKLSNLYNDIYDIQSTGDGRLWLGAVAGLSYFNTHTKQFTGLSGENDLDQQFRKTQINKIIKDADGSLWFATRHGVIFLPKPALRFNYLSNNSKSLKIMDIETQKPDRISFIGDFKAYELNQKTNQITRQFEQINRPYRLAQDASNNQWIATIGQSLFHYQSKNATLTPLLQNRFVSSENVTRGLFDVYVDNQQRVWLLPFLDYPQSYGGIVNYNPDTSQSKYLLNEVTFSDIVQIDDNTLVLSSINQGLYWLNGQTLAASSWLEAIPNSPKQVSTLFKDHQGRLWAGTVDKGLAMIDINLAEKTAKIHYFTTEDGLLTNHIVTIIEDDQHNLWLGSAVGLSRFNPVTHQILNIEQQDGLLFSSFRKRTAAKRTDGQLLMGTKSGLVMFQPNDFTPTQNTARVIINDFKLLNQSVALSQPKQPTVLDNTIEFTDHITLSHRDYVFSFHFTATEYLRPDKVQFAYRMEGLDNKWFYTDASNRTASYTTLSAGEYQFMVKASSPTGVWSEEYATVNVTINPPWWFSWQAFFVYFLVTSYSIYLFINIRTIKLVKQAKQLEKRVSDRTQQLAVKSQTVSDLLSQKQQLFASISHEFRTPLTLILSPVEQMLSRYSDEPLRNDLNLIKRSGKRLLRMVDQLLEFAKLEQDVDYTYEQVSLAQTLNLIIASFEPLLKSNNLALHIDSYEDAIVRVLPDSLNKILLNLLSNAIKYTPEKGQICVTVTQVTSKEGEQVNIEVSDNGIGIPEQDQQTVFERFTRASHNHHESVFGAGIGLALVKELVEANQGKITLTSELNKGTTFVVTLPVANDQLNPTTDKRHHAQDPQEHLSLEVDNVSDAAHTVEAIPQSVAANQMKTILIIDDNADMRALLCNQLTEHYHCKSAANGQIGIALAKEHLPDLVISDVMMPVMDGYEVAQSLKSDPLTNHIPIILLTAKGSVESRIKGLQLLVDDYLAKPFNLKELLLRINNILTIRDILRKRFAQLINNEPQLKLTQLGLNELDQAFLDKVNDKLSEHYQDSDFNIKALSEQLLLSERQFQRKLKAVFDLNFPELVRNYRLNKSVEQLKAGHRASNICDAVGFASHSYFSQCFKAKYGMTPSAYQQSLGGG